MTFLPIVDRELRVRARQKGTYWFRLAAALAAIVLVGFLLVAFEQVASPGGFGSGLFRILAWLMFGYCLLDGVRSTADCLSEEKRAGTLGLLFLTDLRGYDVVLGKLAACSLNSFYRLLAIFPPLAIPVIVGGVTAGEFWRLVLVLINTLLLSLTAGLCVSAVCRSERRAWGATLLIVGILALVPPLAQWASPRLSSLGLFPRFSFGDTLVAALAAVSPTTAFLSAFDAAYQAGPNRYWQPLLFVHLQVWIFLVAASSLLPRCWQDTPLRRKAARWPRLRPWFGPEQDARRRNRRLLLNLNPALWLAGHNEEPRLVVWFIVLSASGVGLAVSALGVASTEAAFAYVVGAFAVHLVLSVSVASQACYLLADARDSGALELLLSTPLSVGEIVEGHLQALKRLFFWPVVTLVLVEVVILITQTVFMGIAQRVLSPVLLISGGFCLTILILDLYAAGIFGLWMGLSSRRPSQALTKTVLFVLLLPQLSALCCGILWPVVGLVKNLVFIHYGRDQLRRQFRTVVTERFTQGLESSARLESPVRTSDPGRLPSVLPRE